MTIYYSNAKRWPHNNINVCTSICTEVPTGSGVIIIQIRPTTLPAHINKHMEYTGCVCVCGVVVCDLVAGVRECVDQPTVAEFELLLALLALLARTWLKYVNDSSNSWTFLAWDSLFGTNRLRCTINEVDSNEWMLLVYANRCCMINILFHVCVYMLGCPLFSKLMFMLWTGYIKFSTMFVTPKGKRRRPCNRAESI